MAKHHAPGQNQFADYEWMVEDGDDEKLQREVEEQLKYAELERMVMQLEDDSGDVQMLDQFQRMSTHQTAAVKTAQQHHHHHHLMGRNYTPQLPKQKLNVNAKVFTPSWLQKA